MYIAEQSVMGATHRLVLDYWLLIGIPARVAGIFYLQRIYLYRRIRGKIGMPYVWLIYALPILIKRTFGKTWRVGCRGWVGDFSHRGLPGYRVSERVGWILASFAGLQRLLWAILKAAAVHRWWWEMELQSLAGSCGRLLRAIIRKKASTGVLFPARTGRCRRNNSGREISGACRCSFLWIGWRKNDLDNFGLCWTIWFVVYA